VNDHLVRNAGQLQRQTLYAFNEECGVRQTPSLRTPCSVREAIGARVDGERELVWLDPGSVEAVAAVARADVNQNARVRGGE